MKHYCDELNEVQDKNQDTEVYISKHNEDTWTIYLYDGDGVSSPIKYCPYCGEKLI